MPDAMNDPTQPRTWIAKFADAFRGVRMAARGSSFLVHKLMAAAVLICGFVFRVSREEWYVLLLCIASVMAAEVFNSSIESLSRAVDRNHNQDIGDALDMALSLIHI